MTVFPFPFLCLQGVLYREYQDRKTVWEEQKTRLVQEKEEALLIHQQDLIKQKQFKVHVLYNVKQKYCLTITQTIGKLRCKLIQCTCTCIAFLLLGITVCVYFRQIKIRDFQLQNFGGQPFL